MHAEITGFRNTTLVDYTEQYILVAYFCAISTDLFNHRSSQGQHLYVLYKVVDVVHGCEDEIMNEQQQQTAMYSRAQESYHKK